MVADTKVGYIVAFVAVSSVMLVKVVEPEFPVMVV